MRTDPHCLILTAALVAASLPSASAQTGSNFGFGGTTVDGGGTGGSAGTASGSFGR